MGMPVEKPIELEIEEEEKEVIEIKIYTEEEVITLVECLAGEFTDIIENLIDQFKEFNIKVTDANDKINNYATELKQHANDIEAHAEDLNDAVYEVNSYLDGDLYEEVKNLKEKYDKVQL